MKIRQNQPKLYLFILPLFIFLPLGSNAQIYQIGAYAGVSGVIGDLGAEIPLIPNGFGGGLNFRLALSPRFSIYASGLYTTVAGNDADSFLETRRVRGKSYNNFVAEASIGFEYNFFDFAPVTFVGGNPVVNRGTPYFFAGGGFFAHQHRSISIFHGWNIDPVTNQAIEPTNAFDFSSDFVEEDDIDQNFLIPFGVGYKYILFDKVFLDVALGMRFTFTDDLDKNDPSQKSLVIEDRLARDPFSEEIRNKNLARIGGSGNTDDNDWFSFLQIGIVYVFGDIPCACGQ